MCVPERVWCIHVCVGAHPCTEARGGGQISCSLLERDRVAYYTAARQATSNPRYPTVSAHHSAEVTEARVLTPNLKF